MGIYDSHMITNEGGLTEENMQELLEDFTFDAIANLPDKEKRMFLESPEYAEQRNALIEAGLINKNTLVRLNKTSDLERRNQLAVYKLAQQHNDPLWQKFAKAQQMKKEAREAMNRKYHSKAALTAKQAQREYIKKNPISNIRIMAM